MNDKFESILSSLPARSPRSRLEPYCELIEELRRRGCTYREIERILVDQCQLRISLSAINNFMRAQARKRAKLSRRQAVEAAEKNPGIQRGIAERIAKTNMVSHEDLPSDEVLQRIVELKKRPVQSETNSKQFHYDPNEPLQILPNKEGP